MTIFKNITLFVFILVISSCTNVVKSPDGKVMVEVLESGLQISCSGIPVQCIEMEIPPEPGDNIEIMVRNDGVAFRFLKKEIKTAYFIPEGLTRWLGRYSYTGYETLFPPSDTTAAGQWIYPALIEYSEGVFGFIAESGISRGHSCSHLVSTDTEGRYEIQTTDQNPEYDVTPWRFILVGSLSEIVSSTMMTDLAEPCRIEDTSWIQPGVSSWIYWAYNHGSNDFNIIRQYIDLAAEMGWPYCLVDWEWPQMKDGYDIKDILAYAAQKGVKINLWYNSGTSWVGDGAPQPEDRLRDADSREREFAWLESIGVSGVKVDFFAEDGAEMVNYYLDILEDAARHHLLVDFHGCTAPRGWQKTWPNLMSMEAVWGAEWYNNVPFFTDMAASHNATLPFTRALMGPMDYTPCAFSDSQHPHITTYAHELALPVLFQSSLQHMADKPESYLSQSQEVIDFLKGLPAVWDETKLLAGYPGESVVMARRSGDVWCVAGINGTNDALSLDFPELRGRITLFADGTNDREFAISHLESLSSVMCRPNGGFCCVIESSQE